MNYCNAIRRQQPAETHDGQPARCRRPAGWGTPNDVGVCRTHGGATRSHRVRAAALTVERDAAKALDELRQGPIISPSRVSPSQALLSTVTEQAILVAYLRRRIETEVGDRWVGDKMAHTNQGDLYEVSEEERALIAMYRDALRDLNRMSKVAHDAGVDASLQRIAEDQWRLMAEVVRKGLKNTITDPAMRTAAERAIGMELRTLAGSPS